MNEGGEGDRRDGNQQLVSTLACRQGWGINRTKKRSNCVTVYDSSQEMICEKKS
jgi:hypothetical protein